MTATTISPEMQLRLLESEIATELVDHIVMRDPTFRVGDRKVRNTYQEEVPDELADDDALVLIDPDSGDLFEIEIQVYVRKLVPPKDVPVVDPNQLAIDIGTDVGA